MLSLLSDVINIMLIALVFVLWFLIIKKFIGNKLAPVKSVKAEVFDKYKTNVVSKIQGTFKRERCIVVFSTNDKKLSFCVSEFSYANYKVKDRGTLKYKGNKIISFD